jgi:hypothetical protein
MPPVSASLPARDHEAPDPRGTDARDHGAPDPRGADFGQHGTSNPHGADSGGPETLDRYARAGGMAPDRIRRILADLTPSLAALHRAGRAHGDIAPATIGLDESGRARLLTAPLAPGANAEDASRHDGYAAFEQYTDDADTPRGPWTDIYALSATACALLTGLAPPPALARCVCDDYVPLTRRRGQDEQAFCAVLDGGLAMDAYARPQTIDEFARALRLDMMPAAVEPRAPQARSGERLSTLEDADGLEATSAWTAVRMTTGAPNSVSATAGVVSTGVPLDAPAPHDAAGAMPHANAQPAPQPAAGQSSQVAVYRDEQKTVAPTASPETARDPAAVEYEAAVASIHARGDRKTSHPERTKVPPAVQPPQRQRAPLLMILAIIVIIAAALYVWVRPQTPPRSNVVASGSDTASGNARGNAAGNDAKGASAGASNGSGNGNGTSSTAAGNAPVGTPGNASGGSMGADSMPGLASPGAASAPSGTQGANPQSSSSPGAAPADSGTSNTFLATAGAPNAGSATAGAGSPAAGASANGASTTGTSSTGTPSTGNTAVATATPAGSSDAKPSMPADAKPRTSKAPVAVAIAVRPWGEILVNGKSRGVSPPLNSMTLAPGTYDITIRNNAGPDVHQSLTVTAGKTATISHRFN